MRKKGVVLVASAVFAMVFGIWLEFTARCCMGKRVPRRPRLSMDDGERESARSHLPQRRKEIVSHQFRFFEAVQGRLRCDPFVVRGDYRRGFCSTASAFESETVNDLGHYLQSGRVIFDAI